MTKFALPMLCAGLISFGLATPTNRTASGHPVSVPLTTLARHVVVTSSSESLNMIILRYCVVCHNDIAKTGNLSLQAFDVGAAVENAEVAEKMIRKLRAGMMPPPGSPRPVADTLNLLTTELETLLDDAAAAKLQKCPGRLFI